jgi:hypothetical protein
MDPWLTTLTGAVAVLAGSTLTAAISSRTSRIEREERQRDELRASLVAYGVAIDRLSVRIAELPEPRPDRSPVGRMLRVLERWREFDWLMGRISTALFGRRAMQAVDELILATNRLQLVAPDLLREPMAAISDLLERVEHRDAAWRDEWNAARQSLAAASRSGLYGE